MVKKIILVFKTHFDIGFTDLAEHVIHRYGNDMLREVIETCDATASLGRLRYVWTMPAWPLWTICNSCDPALKADLERLIENGQIVWHSLPFTSHTDFSSPEEYAQTLRYSRELARRYGKPVPVTAKMTDVPGHGLMLPDLLDQAGIRFLHLGCNEFATPPQVPGLFFWKGPGGGKVLTMYSKGGYGTGLLPPADWPYPVWMALMHTHDNCGPQSAQIILDLAKQAQAAYPEAEILCGSMDDFYRALSGCDLSPVPVIDRDLADTWIHGVGSYPDEVRRMRACRERAKRLHGRYFAQLAAGIRPDGVEPLWDRYYEQVALFTEHTWGADVKTFLGPDRVYEKEKFLAAKETPPYRFMERSWEEQRDRAGMAEACLDQMEEILGRDAPAAPPVPKEPLKAAHRGDRVLVQNHRYRLELDSASGQILTLYDLRLDTALLEAGAEGVFSYRYDRYGLPDITEFLRSYAYHFTTWGIQDYGRENYPDCPHETLRPVCAGWEIQGRDLRLHYKSERSSLDYGDGRTMDLTVTLPEEGDTLQVAFALHDKQETPFVESGSLVFPFAGKAAYRIGKPGAVIDPETQIQPCANHALFNLEQEVTLLGDHGCLSICAPDVPLFGIGSTGVYAYHKEFGANRPPVLYFNLFNNMWGTNFPQWIGGSFRYRFVLRGCSRQEAEQAPAWAARVCRGAPAKLPEGVTLPEGMELVHTRLEDETLYLTLRDVSGQPGSRRLSVTGAQLCQADLLHRPIGTPGFETLSLPVRPFGIHIVSLRRALI